MPTVDKFTNMLKIQNKYYCSASYRVSTFTKFFIFFLFPILSQVYKAILIFNHSAANTEKKKAGKKSWAISF